MSNPIDKCDPIRNKLSNRYFILVVEKNHEDNFYKYLKSESCEINWSKGNYNSYCENSTFKVLKTGFFSSWSVMDSVIQEDVI